MGGRGIEVVAELLDASPWFLLDLERRNPKPLSTPRPALPLTCKYQLAYSGQVSDVYQALASPARRAILDELYERDGQTLFELCTRLVMKRGLDMSRQAISQHLDVLEAAGLVITEREGRYKFHYLDLVPLAEIDERWPRGEEEKP